MAGGNIKHFVAYVRSDYLLVAVLFLYFTQKLLKTVAQSGAFGQPQRKTGTDILRECEKLHLLSQFAVVAFFCFFKHLEILFKHFLLRECDAVNSHELLTFFVSAPICACK